MEQLQREKYNIVRLTSADLDQVVALWLEGSRRAHHFIPFSYWESNVRSMREIYIPQSDTWVYLEPDHGVAGFISLVENCIAALFVHPAMQGNGIGGRLVKKAKSLKDELNLSVYVKNEHACHFYDTHGFRVIQTRLDSNTGQEEYQMVWRRQR